MSEKNATPVSGDAAGKKGGLHRILGIARTVLANDRTLLAVFRTTLGCLIGGASLLKFFGHPAYEIFGILLMIIAAVILGVGIKRYRKIKKVIGAIDPEDWQVLEAMVEKNPKC